MTEWGAEGLRNLEQYEVIVQTIKCEKINLIPSVQLLTHNITRPYYWVVTEWGAKGLRNVERSEVIVETIKCVKINLFPSVQLLTKSIHGPYGIGLWS